MAVSVRKYRIKAVIQMDVEGPDKDMAVVEALEDLDEVNLDPNYLGQEFKILEYNARILPKPRKRACKA